MFEQPVSVSDALGKLILRLTLGGLILLHGIDKILHPQAIAFISQQLANVHLPGFLVYGVYAGEIVAPLMLIFGVFSRLGGMLVAVNMVFALALVHRAQFLLLGPHGGWQLELQAFYLACGLVIALIGGGRYALIRD
jgi:putative oxidoreductase